MDVQTVGPIVPKLGMGLDGHLVSFGWDVRPRSSLCSTPNMDYKDPEITEEENL